MPTVEERIEALRAELDASADGSRRAVVQYEIGQLTQFGLANEAQAVREYLQAYNHDPQFRPPLIELVSLFERRRSAKNLLRLYDAEARSATTPREAASALADRAILMIDGLDEGEEALQLLEAAFEQAAEAGEVALLLEHELFSRGMSERAMKIVEARADLVDDPVLSALLRLEVARAREEAGDVDGAIAALRDALSTPAARWRVLDELERITRRAKRYPELAAAVEAQAKLAAAAARGEDKGQLSGAFSVQRVESQDAAIGRAAALFREAGRLRTTALADPEGARSAYDAALALRPDDPLLHYERMLACELAGDLDAAADEASRFLDAGAEGALAASLHFRLAERAQAAGQATEAIASLTAGLEADPESTVIAAMLDDLIRSAGQHRAAYDQLVAAAEKAEGAAKAEAWWEAADLAAYRLNDGEAARAAFLCAAEASEDATPILREGLAASLRLGDAEGAKRFGAGLLERELDDEERGALLRDAHELARMVFEDEAATRETLMAALGSPAARAWAPDLARIGAATRRELTLLAEAHAALADRASDDETTAAHLCGAARAHARAENLDAAVESLRAALAKSPTHPYAVALLEEVLRKRGDAEEVVRLLQEAAEQSDAPRAAETRLLLAGAAAEAADDFEGAVKTYEEAAERNPQSLAPLLALRRLAEVRNDDALLLRALEALSQRELASGEAGRHTLALGEHYDLISGQPALAEEPLRKALEGGVGLAAAVDLALVPIEGGDATRLAGLSRLLQRAGPEAKPGMLREATGAALAVGDFERAGDLLEQLRASAPTDRWASLGALRLAALDESQRAARADAWTNLGRSTDDLAVAAELVAHGLRAQVIGGGEEAMDDAVIVAHELAGNAPGSLHSAIALDEALSASDDPEGRASALQGWHEHAGDSGRTSLELARGRALAAAGRPREALDVLLRVAATEADDLASWEAIRGCARDCGAWAPLVEACDRMAHLVPDNELKMLLWEESAATLMDSLGQDDRAERRLRRVLAIDARRPIAYGRLHDLLAERGDEGGLLELVSNRIDLVDDPEELGKLYYEQARLLRSLGMREDALIALDNLLLLDESHVGGLALLVELRVQSEDWAGAVDALQRLASADDVPGSQRRIARLGAADFLDNKLEDPDGALAELTALHDAGLADLEIYQRAADLAERLGRFDTAVEMLSQAVEQAASANIATRFERRIGAIHRDKREDHVAAADAFRRALATSPTDRQSGEALSRLLDGEARVQLSKMFERSVRATLARDPLDPRALRSLARAGAWRADTALQNAVTGVLIAAGLADDEEQIAWRASGVGALPRAAMDETGLAAIQTPGVTAETFRLATSLSEATAEMDGLQPAGFGLARGDLVKQDTPLKMELRALGAAFGLPPCELYQGGSDPNRIDIAPNYKGRLTWIAGRGVSSPLSPDQRFTIGWLAIGARLGVAPFVRRGPQGAAGALFAAADAAEAPLPAGAGRHGHEDTKKRIYKAMPRRVRKSVPDLIRSLGVDGASIDAWAHELARTANRAGLLASNDLVTTLHRVLGAAPTPELVRASSDAMDLVYFWLSTDCIAIRRRLGLVA